MCNVIRRRSIYRVSSIRLNIDPTITPLFLTAAKMGYKDRLSKAYIKKLDGIYHTFGAPGGYGSVIEVLKRFRKLHPELPISRNEVQDYLDHQTTYTLHRRRVDKFERNIVSTPRVGYQWSVDLAEMAGFKKYNDGMRYFLLAVDTLSRFVYTEPVTRKTGECVAAALGNIFDRADELPKLMNGDAGKEFDNRKVAALLKKHDIRFFQSYGVIKASHAEIAIKTLKSSIYRYFDHTLTRRWVDVLQKATDTYNDTYHTAIKMTPRQGGEFLNGVKLSERGLRRAVNRFTSCRTPRLKKGDSVRVSLNIKFKKGFEQNWSRAIYLVASEPYYTCGGHQPMYLITELNGERFLGGFYQSQLLPVSKRTFVTDYAYPIDSVIKKGAKTSKVRFTGYDERYDRWIDNKLIKDIVRRPA